MQSIQLVHNRKKVNTILKAFKSQTELKNYLKSKMFQIKLCLHKLWLNEGAHRIFDALAHMNVKSRETHIHIKYIHIKYKRCQFEKHPPIHQMK